MGKTVSLTVSSLNQGNGFNFTICKSTNIPQNVKLFPAIEVLIYLRDLHPHSDPVKGTSRHDLKADSFIMVCLKIIK